MLDDDSWYGYDSMIDTSEYSSDDVEESDSESYSSGDENVTPFWSLAGTNNFSPESFQSHENLQINWFTSASVTMMWPLANL